MLNNKSVHNLVSGSICTGNPKKTRGDISIYMNKHGCICSKNTRVIHMHVFQRKHLPCQVYFLFFITGGPQTDLDHASPKIDIFSYASPENFFKKYRSKTDGGHFSFVPLILKQVYIIIVLNFKLKVNQCFKKKNS